jgi:hypothetical protein
VEHGKNLQNGYFSYTPAIRRQALSLSPNAGMLAAPVTPMQAEDGWTS